MDYDLVIPSSSTTRCQTEVTELLEWGSIENYGRGQSCVRVIFQNTMNGIYLHLASQFYQYEAKRTD